MDGYRVRILEPDAMREAADACALPQNALHATFMYPCPPKKSQ
jgi:hypothetical protein